MPTLPSCYIYFSWWQLRFTTQHSKYKWCGVKGDGSDRFATSRRDFKILVPERLPVPEGGRDTARRAPAGEGDGGEKSLEPAGCGSEAVQAGGRRRHGQMEEALGANRTMGWHRQ